jgi:glycosidase
MKRLLFFLWLLLILVGSCRQESSRKEASPDPLSWATDAVMYEVNVRQYTPEGTFDAFAEHLPRLQDLGVDILWFMPIHPIGEKNRKGTLGSYYSIRDYQAVNPEFGTMEDFQELVDKAHTMGFKVLIDCVANHTAWDNPWLEDHKDWYTRDSLGHVVPPVADWSDVADLNYENPDMRTAMLNAMKFWVVEADIDGYRCDYAGGVPADFWEQARKELDAIKPVFMLAEDQDNLNLLEKAFHCNYGWTFHHTMNEIYNGEKSIPVIPEYFNYIDSVYPEGTYPLQFTSNHDENSWNGTVYERLGEAVKTFTALQFTVPGMPLIYSGQEAGLNNRLDFFEKDQIEWGNNPEITSFYASLINLKKSCPPLWNGKAGGKIQFLDTSEPEKMLAFKRMKGEHIVLVVMNLSAQSITGTVDLEEKTTYRQFPTDQSIVLGGIHTFDMDPWSYRIFTVS